VNKPQTNLRARQPSWILPARIENAASLYGCAGGPFVDVFIVYIEDVVCCAVACRTGHLQILIDLDWKLSRSVGMKLRGLAIPGIAKEDPAIRVGEAGGKGTPACTGGFLLAGGKNHSIP